MSKFDVFQAIKCFLAQLGVDKLCQGQGYDGAGAMAGELRGCQALLKAEVPEATYFHCSSHQLNLALSKASSVPEVYRMVSTMKQLRIYSSICPRGNVVLKKQLKM